MPSAVFDKNRGEDVTVKENDSFVSVRLAKESMRVERVVHMGMSGHAGEDRKRRFDLALRQNQVHRKQAPFDAVFEVDKGHDDGLELHCVTERGIIFILNQYKYHMEHRPIITVFLARKNQVERLYEAVGMKVPEKILDCCKYYAKHGMNE